MNMITTSGSCIPSSDEGSESESCQTIPQDGLVASYLLTGTAEDETGLHNGTENGNTYEYDAERGVVASFDGVDDYTDLGNIPSLEDSVSFSVWIKVDTIEDCHIISTAPTYNTDFRLAMSSSTNIYCGIYDSSSGVVLGNTEQLTPNIWHHIVFTKDSENDIAKMYINNVLHDSASTASLGQISRVANPCIGSSTSHNNSFFDGQMSNLHIYNRALSEAEVTQIYDAENGVHNIPVDDGLIAYYPLDGNSLDNAINQYDGTDSGVSYVYDSELEREVASFDGESSNIVYGSSSSANISGSATMSFWIKINFNTRGGIFNRGTSGDYSFMLIYDTSTINTGTGNTIKYYSPATGWLGMDVSMSTDVLYHVAVVVDATYGIMFYLDGVLVLTLLDPSSAIESNSLSIETGKDYNGNYFNGQLSNMRIYNRVLSQTEIEKIYNYEKPNPTLCLQEAQ